MKDETLTWMLIGVGAYLLLANKKPAAVATIAPTSPLKPSTGNRATTGTITPSGSSYIKWYQAALNATQGANLEIDGIHGPMTTEAVKAFQTSWGLTVDGVVGPETDYYLHAALGDPGYLEQAYQA